MVEKVLKIIVIATYGIVYTLLGVIWESSDITIAPAWWSLYGAVSMYGLFVIVRWMFEPNFVSLAVSTTIKYDDYRDNLTEEDIWERCCASIRVNPINANKIEIQKFCDQFNLDFDKLRKKRLSI